MDTDDSKASRSKLFDPCSSPSHPCSLKTINRGDSALEKHALAQAAMEGPGDILIRSARAEDASAIAEVVRRAFAAYEGRLQPPAGALKETPESIAEKLRHEAGLVAVTPAGIAGCVFYRPAEAAGEIYLGRLAVLPEHQGEGIGARLMAALEEAARAAGARALSLNVRIALPDNRAVFERLGFRAVGEGRHPGFDQPTFTVMRKAVSGAAPTAMRSR